MCPDVMGASSARSALSCHLQHELSDQDRFTQILGYMPYINDPSDIDSLEKQQLHRQVSRAALHLLQPTGGEDVPEKLLD